MSRRASPTMIGLFVLGAIFLVLVGLVLFGSGRFFQDRMTYSVFFDGSLHGLTLGAVQTEHKLAEDPENRTAHRRTNRRVLGWPRKLAAAEVRITTDRHSCDIGRAGSTPANNLHADIGGPALSVSREASRGSCTGRA